MNEQTPVEWLINELHKKEQGLIETSYNHIFDKAKEIEHQKRMYSEKEVKRFAFDFYYDMSRKMKVPVNLVSENATNVDVWFNNFKKNKI
jgi:hypothetical protein